MIILSFLASCSGRKQTKVSTNIAIAGFTGSSLFNGGIMIWGQGPEGKNFALSLADENVVREVELDSGSWRFMAIGWEGIIPLDGARRCALTEGFIEGEEAVINLDMSSSNCLEEEFGPSDFTDGASFLPLKLISCSNISSVSSGTNCDASKGEAKSFRLNFLEGQSDTNVFPGLTSICIQETSPSLSTTSTTYRIPVGSTVNAQMMPFALELYSDTNCNDTIKTLIYPFGLIGSDAAGESVLFSSGSEAELFFETALAPLQFTGGYLEHSPSYPQNTPITPNLPLYSGTATSFSVAPALPTGLTLNTVTGEISGTPVGTIAPSNYVITASGPAGSDTFTMIISVTEQAPMITNYTNLVGVYYVGNPISSMIASTTGGSVSTYAVAPALPSGLTLNSVTGEISGTPAVSAASTTYVITAANGGGSNDFAITFEVQAPANLNLSDGPTFDFGVKGVGSSSNHILTLSNSGGAVATAISNGGLSGGFTFTGGSFPGTGGDCGSTLAGGANCTIDVSFSPGSTGAFAATLTIFYNNGLASDTATRDLAGTGANAALLTITESDPYNFGQIAVGQTQTHIFTIGNTGALAASSIAEVGLTLPYSFLGGSFPGTGGTCTGVIIGGGSCDIVVAYSPTSAAGVENSTINLQYNNGVSAVNVTRNVMGEGLNPAVLTLSDGPIYDFGNVTSGGSSTHLLTLTNSGGMTATALSGSGLALPYRFTGSSYPGSGGSCGGTLAPAGSCTIEVEFQPGSTGSQTDTLTVSYDDGTATTLTATRDLQGNGVGAASLTITDGANYDYGLVGVYDVNPTTFISNYDVGADTPSLSNGVGTIGNYHTVVSAGVKDFGGGPVSFALGDIAYYTGSVWRRGDPKPSKLFTIQNTGGSDATGLSLQTLTAGYAETTASTCTPTLSSGQSCTIEIETIQTAIGRYTHSLVVDYNDGVTSQNVSIALEARAGKVVDVAGAAGSTCAVFANGQVKCWGRNNVGQLGLGDTTDRGDLVATMGSGLPVTQLGAGFFAKKIVAGNEFFCALSATGQIKCWGDNSNGQLGHEDALSKGDNVSHMGNNLPITDVGGNVVDIDAGAKHVCALLDNQTLKCWGDGGFGQTGLGTSTDWGITSGQMGGNLPPVDLGTGLNAVKFSAGTKHTCAILNNGRVKCWGAGLDGALGNEATAGAGASGGSMGDNLPPVELGGGNAMEIIASTDHSCVILDTTQVKCWGKNANGRLGHGTTAPVVGDAGGSMGVNLPPTDVTSGPVPVRLMKNDEGSVCVQLVDNTVKCWGKNEQGQLGQESTTDLGTSAGHMGGSLPVLNFGSGRQAIHMGTSGHCVILDNHELKCWGSNAYGQLGLENTSHYGDNPSEMGDNLPPVLLH